MSLESKAARADRRRRRRLAPPPQYPSVNKPASRPPEGSPAVIHGELSDGTLVETFMEYPKAGRSPATDDASPVASIQSATLVPRATGWRKLDEADKETKEPPLG